MNERSHLPGGGHRHQRRSLWQERKPVESVSVRNRRPDQSIFTMLIPAPSVSVNANRTLIVGLSHLCNLSSLLLDSLNWWTWSWSMARIAAGVSHLSSWLARGCVVRRCLVFFLYSLRAFSKMELKLEVDTVGAGGLEDGPGVGG